jgi:hypothetical protein
MKKILIGVCILFLLSALFYWFQIRPSMIRSSCWKSFVKNAKSGNESNGANISYRICLVENGMKPEDLINEK